MSKLSTVSAREEWVLNNPVETRWVIEMMVRKELGGYCPSDPLEFEFISTLIILNNAKSGRKNTENRLQNIINKSK